MTDPESTVGEPSARVAVDPSILEAARVLTGAARIVIVNGEPTDLDDLADVVVRGPISDILPALTG